MTALKRYKRSYKLRTRHNSSKTELVTAITKHFATIPVNEVEIIELFLETVNTATAGKSKDPYLEKETNDRSD